MESIDVRRITRDFIRGRFMIGRPDSALDDSDSMLEKGILDSTGVMELVEFLEDRFEIHVQDEELTPENLGSIENIVRYIQEKSIAI